MTERIQVSGNQFHAGEPHKVITREVVAAALEHIIHNRRSFDVTYEIAKSGDQRRFLRDAISDFNAPIMLVDVHPERYKVTMTAVVPPGTNITDVFHFALQVSIFGRPVGESHFDLRQLRQSNPNWAGVGSDRACHPIEPERLEILKRFLAAVNRSVNEEQSHSE